MKRTASVICAAMLSVALAACGGAQDSSTAAKEESSPTATEEVATEEKDAKAEKADKAEGADESGKAKEAAEEADPTEKFLGEWKPAAITMGGQVIVGNIDTFLYSESEDTKGYLRVSEDGAGVVHSSGAPADTIVKFTWELVGDDELRLVNEPAAGAEDATETVTTLTFRDGELTNSWQDGDDVNAIHYSRDGTTNAYETYDLAEATEVTDAEGLVGTWSPIAVKNDGTMIIGDLSGMGSLNEPCEFREDGTATVMGEDNFTWEVGEDGATLVVEGLGLPCRVLAYDDKIIVDLSAMEALTGGMGEGMQIVYAK